MQRTQSVSRASRARELVRGAYDLHVHIGPDVPKRVIDDLSLAVRCRELGLAGFALKSHYTSTAERARSSRRRAPGVRVVGTLTLNRAVGGMNPVAVEIAAREGARIVWMPTFDSAAETAGRVEPKPGQHVPIWAKLQHELRALGIGVEPVLVRDENGILPETPPGAATRSRGTGSCSRPATSAATTRSRSSTPPSTRASRPSSSRIRSSRARASRSRSRSRSSSAAASSSAASARRSAGRRRGSTSSRASARSASRTTSSRATSATPTTPRSRTGSRCGPTRCSSAGFGDDEITGMIVDGSRRVAG